MKRNLAMAVAAIMTISSGSAYAGTVTGNFNVSVSIVAECRVNSTTDLNFGNQGVMSSNVDATSSLSVQCTSGTPFNIGLNKGVNGASVSDRRMKAASGTDTVAYHLYRDAARTLNWGDTVATDTLAGTGNGSNQVLTVYARLPAQTGVATGTYTDTVTVTVTY